MGIMILLYIYILPITLLILWV